jgi:hypothetical protein
LQLVEVYDGEPEPAPAQCLRAGEGACVPGILIQFMGVKRDGTPGDRLIPYREGDLKK